MKKRVGSHPEISNPYEEDQTMERNGDRRRLSKWDFFPTILPVTIDGKIERKEERKIERKEKKDKKEIKKRK